MDAFSDPTVHTVVMMVAAQMIKTEALLNVIGFYIHHDPAPILLAQPTLDMGESFSKDRLAPMLRDTPALRGRVSDPRSRDSGNTLLHKKFHGGHLTIVGANSPASLASRPIRVVLCDEIDKYPTSVGTEGDPVKGAVTRATTFWNRKIGLASTPTIKGSSRIEVAYSETDQREYLVPCPDCETLQTMKWEQVKWQNDDESTAQYACEHCGSLWDDVQRIGAVGRGQWQAKAPFKGRAGFHINALCSPWKMLNEVVSDFLEAKRARSSPLMRRFTNEVLGLTFEDEGEHPDDGSLFARRERWDGIPEGVLIKTCGVDVQGNRLELELVGWGMDEESWSLDYVTLWGDPASPQVWADLDTYLIDNKPDVTCIDTGGHHTQMVYKFCEARYRRRVYAVKGMAGSGRPVWPKKTAKAKGSQVHLFIVGVDSAKDQVYSRLRLQTPGPGYCHLPRDRQDEWFFGLISEEVITKYSKGFPVREYRLPAGKRNEPLDCRNYAYAGLCSLGKVDWRQLALHVERVRNPPRVEVVPDPLKVFRPPMPRRSGWVNNF